MEKHIMYEIQEDNSEIVELNQTMLIIALNIQ